MNGRVYFRRISKAEPRRDTTVVRLPGPVHDRVGGQVTVQDEPLVRNTVPDAALLETCLQRIRLSAEFVRSDRMVRFLQVVVEHAMQNRASRLTERHIGCEVFDRPPDWDPSIDTIVRSEARRLRAKLDQYYERQGKLDPIRITIPKGRYGVEFELRK